MKIKRRNFSPAIILLSFLVSGCDTGEVKAPFKPSDAPTGLVAKVISQSEILLTWRDNSSEDGFIIERRTGRDVSFALIARTAADVTSYKSSRLSPETTYYYRVAYYKGNEKSDYSTVANATTLEKLLLLKERDATQYLPQHLQEVAPVLKLLNDLVNGSNPHDNGDDILEYKDFTVVTTRTDDGIWHYSMDGTLTAESCGDKKFVIKTIHPLNRPSASACPIEGEVLITYEDRFITLRFLKDQTVDVEQNPSYPPLHKGGNEGGFKDTVSCEVLLASDSCL